MNNLFEGRGCPFCGTEKEIEAAVLCDALDAGTGTLLCAGHFLKLTQIGGKENGKEKFIAFLKKCLAEAENNPESNSECGICRQIKEKSDRCAAAILKEYEANDNNMRELFFNAEYFCIPHHNLLRELSQNILSKPSRGEFLKKLDGITGKYTEELRSDIRSFCDSFDYRNAGKLHSKEMLSVRVSVQRTIDFLKGKE